MLSIKKKIKSIFLQKRNSINHNNLQRNAFHEWLREDITNDGDVTNIVNCIDKVSEYAIIENITSENFWSIINPITFKDVHLNIIFDVVFKLTNRRLYETYNLAGPLYLRFLEGKEGVYHDTEVLKDNNEKFIINNTTDIKTTKDINKAKVVEKVLKEHFPTGFNINSPIELMRFRKYLSIDYYKGIILKDEELLSLIYSAGSIFNDEVYIIENETIVKIDNIINEEIDKGTEIIFYKEFYERHEKWLYSKNIVSEDMLRSLLMEMYSQYIHKINYFSTSSMIETELIQISNEIKRVWGEKIKLTYKQLELLLPYVPIDKIKYVLSQDSYFIWESTETYTNIDKIEINEEEYEKVKEYVAKSYLLKGFSSLSDIPMRHLLELNSELSLTAIQNGIFVKVLSYKYVKKGKIITRKGNKLDVFTIIKEFCKERDKCTLQELFNYEKDLTGKVYRRAPMEAGYEILVRVNKEDFVAEKYVDFNTKEIDNAIREFILYDYLPLRGITTFATFPHCNYPWNLFLLESYCRRFSEGYYFNSLAVNSRNVGVIIRKNYALDYHQIMVDAVYKSGLLPEKDIILEYLFNTGYLGRRAYSKINELIRDLKAILGGNK